MSYSYGIREITHGTEQSAIIEIKADGKFGVPQSVTGLRGVSIETEQEQNSLYADNQVHMVINGAKKASGDIRVYQFPKEIYKHIGLYENENGLVTDSGTFQNFAYQYVRNITLENGEEFRELVIYYNLKASTPTSEDATDEDSVEGKEFSIPITASTSNDVVDDKGKKIMSATFRETPENKSLFEKYLTEVITPQTTPN